MMPIEQDRVISAATQRDEEVYDRAVRPKTLADYVGQPRDEGADGDLHRRRRASAARRSTTC